MEGDSASRRPLRVMCSQQSPLRGSQATPPSSANARRKRTARATNNQFEALVTLMEERRFLATRRFSGPQDREKHDAAWREVATDLNSLGPVKTPEQWMTVWRDLKSRVCTKAAKLKEEIYERGNLGKPPQLTDTEKRIISLLDADYSNCPDSTPEGDTGQSQLEVDELSEATNQTKNEIVFEEITEDALNLETIHPAPSQPQIASRDRSSNALAEVYERVYRNPDPRRSISEQRSVDGNEFLTVAETNAESMRMLAAAVKMQAESAKVQAEASLLYAQATNKIADALIKFAENKNNL